MKKLIFSLVTSFLLVCFLWQIPAYADDGGDDGDDEGTTVTQGVPTANTTKLPPALAKSKSSASKKKRSELARSHKRNAHVRRSGKRFTVKRSRKR